MNWQKRRNKINHDDLKNDFALRVFKLANMLSGEVVDAKKMPSDTLQTMKEWSKLSIDIKGLINDFLKEMSPKSLFDILPLSRCDEETLSWLPDTVESEWKKQYAIDNLCNSAYINKKNADMCAEKICEYLKNGENSILQSNRNKETLENLVINFQHSIDGLSEAISRLPRRIMI